MGMTLGSPPRMRGKDSHAALCGVDNGITPAYAGKRGRVWLDSETLQDHPRVCGEKERLEMTVRAIMGSPPRMRGKGSD